MIKSHLERPSKEIGDPKKQNSSTLSNGLSILLIIKSKKSLHIQLQKLLHQNWQIQSLSKSSGSFPLATTQSRFGVKQRSTSGSKYCSLEFRITILEDTPYTMQILRKFFKRRVLFNLNLCAIEMQK
jgi:hypothetical protein